MVLCAAHQQQTCTCTLHSISACLRLISCSCTCRSLFCTVSVCTRSWRQRPSCSARRSWLLWIWFCVSKITFIKDYRVFNSFTFLKFSDISKHNSGVCTLVSDLLGRWLLPSEGHCMTIQVAHSLLTSFCWLDILCITLTYWYVHNAIYLQLPVTDCIIST